MYGEYTMNSKLLRKIKIAGLTLLSFLICFLFLQFYVVYINSHDLVTDLNSDKSNVGFTYDISKRWTEHSHGYSYGMQCDLKIINEMKVGISNWRIDLDIEDNSYIDSSWNANFELDGNTVHVTPSEVTKIISPGESPNLGMIVLGTSADVVRGGKLYCKRNARLRDLWLFWILVVVLFAFVVFGITAELYSVKNDRLKKEREQALSIINQSFITFSNMIDAKDTYTRGHSLRVACYSKEIAKRLGLSEIDQENIYYIGLLHDIGKIGVTDAILKKSTKLTYDEFNEIKEHVSMGGDILKKFTAIPDIEAGARYHHEKYDGSGYMEGLKGEEIPLVARIICVADAFDAMTSNRSYRKALDIEKVKRELKDNSGSQFDPQIVPYILFMIDEGVAPVQTSYEELEAELRL